VEIKQHESGMIMLRSSLSPWAVSQMTKEEFEAFIASAKAGDYDHFFGEFTKGSLKVGQIIELRAEGEFTSQQQHSPQLWEGYTGDL